MTDDQRFVPTLDEDTAAEDEAEEAELDNQGTETVEDRDENDISGTTPDPESDDDVLENAHQVGVGLDEDLENPEELDISKDVERAERYHRDRDEG